MKTIKFIILIACLLFIGIAAFGQIDLNEHSSLFVAEVVTIDGQTYETDTEDRKVALFFFSRKEGDVTLWTKVHGEESIGFFDFYKLSEDHVDSDGNPCTIFFIKDTENNKKYQMRTYVSDKLESNKMIFMISPEIYEESQVMLMMGEYIPNLSDYQNDKL